MVSKPFHVDHLLHLESSNLGQSRWTEYWLRADLSPMQYPDRFQSQEGDQVFGAATTNPRHPNVYNAALPRFIWLDLQGKSQE